MTADKQKRMTTNQRRRRRAALIERDGLASCAICGLSMGATGGGRLKATIDHIVPRSKGGTHDLSNLRLVHLRCNLERGDES